MTMPESENHGEVKQSDRSDFEIANAIREREVPELLYKFRTWMNKDKPHDHDIITDQTAWFASPASFNDPFDCKIPYRHHLLTSDQQFRRVYERGQEHNPNWDKDRLTDETNAILRNHPMFSSVQSVREKAMNDYSELMSEAYGILCLSGNCDNIVMWSHYADSHHGFCVEFDGHLLADYFYRIFKTDGHIIKFSQVAYEREMPLVIPSDDDNKDYDRHIQILTTKYSVWEYEEESRFIYSAKTNLARSIPKLAIKRVILGCQLTGTNRDALISDVRSNLPETEIWQAQRDFNEYKLRLEPIE